MEARAERADTPEGKATLTAKAGAGTAPERHGENANAGRTQQRQPATLNARAMAEAE